MQQMAQVLTLDATNDDAHKEEKDSASGSRYRVSDLSVLHTPLLCGTFLGPEYGVPHCGGVVPKVQVQVHFAPWYRVHGIEHTS